MSRHIRRPPLPAVLAGGALLCVTGIVLLAITGSWLIMWLVAAGVILILLGVIAEVMQMAGG